MTKIDFVIEDQGSEEANAVKIIEHLFGRKLKAGMPIVAAFIGKSRSGKSCFALSVGDIIYNYFNLDFTNFVRKSVLLSPEDWTVGLEKIVDRSPDTKDLKVLHLDEAKFVISTDNWQSGFNKVVRAAAGVSASIQPMAFLIVAQLRKDIDPRMRETLDYLFLITRSPNHKPLVRVMALYEWAQDMSTIKIKPRPVRGMIQRKDGTYRKIKSLILRPKMPRKEVHDIYLQFENPDKMKQLKQMINVLRKEQQDPNLIDAKLNELADRLIKNPLELESMGSFTKGGKYKISKDAQLKYNYTPYEFGELEQKIRDRLKVKKTEVKGEDTDATAGTI